MLNKILIALFLLTAGSAVYGVLRTGINAYDTALHAVPATVLYHNIQTF